MEHRCRYGEPPESRGGEKAELAAEAPPKHRLPGRPGLNLLPPRPETMIAGSFG